MGSPNFGITDDATAAMQQQLGMPGSIPTAVPQGQQGQQAPIAGQGTIPSTIQQAQFSMPPLQQPTMIRPVERQQPSPGKTFSAGADKKNQKINAIGSLINAAGGIINKRKEEKFKSLQFDLQRAMEAANANQQILAQYGGDPSKVPPQLQKILKQNNDLTTSIMNGANGKDIEKALKLPQLGENPKNPDHYKALQGAQQAVQKKSAVNQFLSTVLRSFAGRGGQQQQQTVPVQGQQQQQVPGMQQGQGPMSSVPGMSIPGMSQGQGQTTIPTTQPQQAMPQGQPQQNPNQGQPQAIQPSNTAAAPSSGGLNLSQTDRIAGAFPQTMVTNPVAEQQLVMEERMVKAGLIISPLEQAKMDQKTGEKRMEIEGRLLERQVEFYKDAAMEAIRQPNRVALAQDKAAQQNKLQRQRDAAAMQRTVVAHSLAMKQQDLAGLQKSFSDYQTLFKDNQAKIGNIERILRDPIMVNPDTGKAYTEKERTVATKDKQILQETNKVIEHNLRGISNYLGQRSNQATGQNLVQGVQTPNDILGQYDSILDDRQQQRANDVFLPPSARSNANTPEPGDEWDE